MAYCCIWCTFRYISPRLAPFSGLNQDFISKPEWGPGKRFTSYTLAIKIRRLSLKQIDPVCMNTKWNNAPQRGIYIRFRSRAATAILSRQLCASVRYTENFVCHAHNALHVHGLYSKFTKCDPPSENPAHPAFYENQNKTRNCCINV